MNALLSLTPSKAKLNKCQSWVTFSHSGLSQGESQWCWHHVLLRAASISINDSIDLGADLGRRISCCKHSNEGRGRWIREGYCVYKGKISTEDSAWFSVRKWTFQSNSHFPQSVHFEISRGFTTIFTDCAVPTLWKTPGQTETLCCAPDTSSLFLRCSWPTRRPPALGKPKPQRSTLLESWGQPQQPC